MYPNAGQVQDVAPAKDGLREDLNRLNSRVMAIDKAVSELERMLEPLLCPAVEVAEKSPNTLAPTPSRAPLRDHVENSLDALGSVTMRLRNLIAKLEV